MIANIDAFINRLEVIGGVAPNSTADRRALAALRRTLALWPTAPPEAIRVVAPFLPEEVHGWRERNFYLVAGLFATHPCMGNSEAGGRKSFGKSLQSAAVRDPAQGPERRLLALLGCKREDLPHHLRHAVSYLGAWDVAVDYRQLMKDLFLWEIEGSPVQRRWGRDFWAGGPAETEQDAKSDIAEESSNVR